MTAGAAPDPEGGEAQTGEAQTGESQVGDDDERDRAGGAPPAAGPAWMGGRKPPVTLEEAFGGKKGLLDMGLPGVLFVALFVIFRDMSIAIWSAVAVGAILAIIRLVRKDTVQHALAGFVGVAIAAYVAHKTGKPENFYLPSLILNVGEAVAFAISIAVRWPLLGVALGVVFGEGTRWRKDPPRRRAYTLASALWLGMFCLRLVVLVPLYLAGQLVALGAGRLALGYPLYLLVLWLSWRIIKQTRPATAFAAEAPEQAEPETVEPETVEPEAGTAGPDPAYVTGTQPGGGDR